MPKLSKVQKKVAKKQGRSGGLHENSRDARKLRRAGARVNKLEKLKTARSKANNTYIQRTEFIQNVANVFKKPFDLEGIHEIIQQFISRFDEELANFKAQRRPGQPAHPTEPLLERRIEAEEQEYAAGLWLPDLHDQENIDQLLSWNGEWASMNNIRFVRISRGGEVKASSFPPQGQS